MLEANAIFRQTWALSREARSVLRAGIARTLELDPSRGWHYAVALEVLSFLQSAGMSVSQIALILDLCMWRSAEDFRPSRVKADHPGCRLRRILALIEAGTVSSSSKDVVGELCQTLGWCRPREVAQAVKTQAETFIAPLMGEPANALSGYRRYLEELHSFLDRRINEGPGFFSVPSEWKATLESAVKDKLIVSQYGGEIRLGRYMSPESKEELRMQDGSLEIPYMPPGAEDWYEYWFLGEILRQVLTEGDVSCPLEASRSCVARGDAVCTRDSIIADEMECAFGSVCAWLRLSRFG